LPFCCLTLNFKKPLSKYYPKEINTLGDHLKKRRLDRGLLQKQVAERIGVDETTIYNWERQRTLPEIRFIAPIIEFLGYDPFPEPETFPEKLKACRLRMGLSQRKLAAKLGIDPKTLGDWERARHKSGKKFRELIDFAINGKSQFVL
jgi:transcriptional regulator with XRE-family HTH domain